MIDCSNVTVTLEQVIKWAHRGRNAYIALLKSIALWQLSHPEEAKVIQRTDEELLSLLPYGINEDGTLRINDHHWLLPSDLKAAIENPVVYDYLRALAKEGDAQSQKIINKYEQAHTKYIKKLIDNICYQSTPVTSIDRNDVNRIIQNKKYTDGVSVIFSGNSYPKFLNRICIPAKNDRFKLTGLLVYIEISHADTVNDMTQQIGALIEYIGASTSSDERKTVVGLGKSANIKPGYFHLTILFGYS